MDRKSFLKARKKLRHPDESTASSDRFDMPSPDKKKKKKRKRPRISSPSADEAVPDPEPVVSPHGASLGKKDKPGGKRKKKTARQSTPSPEPPAPRSPTPPPRSPTPPPKSPTPPPRSPTPPPRSPKPTPEKADVDDQQPSTSTGVRKVRVRYRQPVEYVAPMILDELTGEFRPARPDDQYTDQSDGDDASLPGDAAEEDDFFDRNYPLDEDGDVDYDSDTEMAQAIAGARPTPEWRYAVDADRETFVPPDFEYESGPNFELPPHAREVEYFYKFLSPELIKVAVRETNKYATFHQQNIAKSINKRWKRVDFSDMSAFIGMLVVMGVHRLPSLEDYWSSDIFLQVQGIAQVMTRARFQMIMRYFHLCDPQDDPRRDPNEESRRRRCEADPLYKINPWLEPITARCVHNYQLGQEISIDEGMIRFKGRSKFKQRLPHKPDRDGFKIWQLCDSRTSYVYNLSPYLGVKYKEQSGNAQGQKREKNTVQRITLELVAPVMGNNHILFCDSLFTTVITARMLFDEKVYMVGSFNRRNRRSMPPQLIPPGSKKRLPLKEGEMRAATHTDWQLNITAYQDTSAQVLILNTAYPPKECETVTSASGKEVHVPLSLQNYRRYMGGVDRSNQMRKYYHTGRKNNRWWVYMACYLIDISLVNAYICFKDLLPETKITHKSFQVRVGKQLIGGYSSRSQPTLREVEKTATQTFIREENISSHVIGRLPGRQKSCKQCSRDGKKTPTGRAPETSKGCVLCAVHLHEGECFAAFHHRMALRGKRSVGTQTGVADPAAARRRKQPSRAARGK